MGWKGTPNIEERTQPNFVIFDEKELEDVQDVNKNNSEEPKKNNTMEAVVVEKPLNSEETPNNIGNVELKKPKEPDILCDSEHVDANAECKEQDNDGKLEEQNIENTKKEPDVEISHSVESKKPNKEDEKRMDISQKEVKEETVENESFKDDVVINEEKYTGIESQKNDTFTKVAETVDENISTPSQSIIKDETHQPITTEEKEKNPSATIDNKNDKNKDEFEKNKHQEDKKEDAKDVTSNKIDSIEQSSKKTNFLKSYKYIHTFWFPLDLSTAPIICVLIFLATQAIAIKDTVMIGVLGENSPLAPYSVIIIFMSLSYICLSLDSTGLFKWFAKFLVGKTKSQGHLLFLGTCIFAGGMTLFTSNDIVCLTLTPIMCYISKTAENIDPLPFLISQFFMANISGVILQIGNSTNIIVSQAFNISFGKYFLWMAIPGISVTIMALIIMYIIFCRKLPRRVIIEVVKPNGDEEVKRTKLCMFGAISKFLGLVLCLMTLLATSFVGNVEAWYITLAFLFIFVVFDICIDIYNFYQSKRRSFKKLIKHSIFLKVVKGMPWNTVPFLIGMFIFVYVLRIYGWISLFAHGLSKFINILAGTPQATFGSNLRMISASVFVMIFLSSIACNFMSNQPMTIFFTYIITDPEFVLPSDVMKSSAVYGLILGSNLGACISLIGALAGILWLNLIKQFGVPRSKMNFWKFMVYGLTITPLLIIVGAVVLCIEQLIIATT